MEALNDVQMQANASVGDVRLTQTDRELYESYGIGWQVMKQLASENEHDDIEDINFGADNMTNGNCMQIQLASIRPLVHNAILHVGLRGYLIMAGHQDETCQAKQVAQHVHDLLLLY